MNIQVEAEGIEDLVNEILAAANGMDDTTSQLTRLAIDIQNELRSTTGFNDRTGNLRRSMRAYVYDNTLTIKMLYYGYFLSFGTRDGAKSPLTPEVATVFNKADYSFFKQPDNNRGIAARRFYPTDIEELIASRLEAIAQNLED